MSPPCWGVFLLLFCLAALAEAKRPNGEGKPNKPHKPPLSSSAPQTAKRPHSRSVPGSGTLTTKEGHRCTWETSGQGQVNLLVSCSVDSDGEQQRYWCRFSGRPDQCQAYSAKSSQFWKQLVGKLKKRHNACEGEKVLRAKTCKKAPAETHMKLAQRSGEETPAERKGEQAGGKRREPSAGGEGESKKKKKAGVEEEKGKRDEGVGFVEEEMLNDMDPVQSYCAEGWHSVCSFFVRFFEA